MEGDGIGGAINMVMKDAPSVKSFSINTSSGYNSLYIDNTGSIIINYELVAKWLRMTIGNLKKTIIRSYIENVDYLITINKYCAVFQ
jgi:hypothetical protein